MLDTTGLLTILTPILNINNRPTPSDNKTENSYIRIIQNKAKKREPDIYNKEYNKLKKFFI